jgi:hypothetical protein
VLRWLANSLCSQVSLTGSNFLTFTGSAAPKVIPVDTNSPSWMLNSLWYLGQSGANYTIRSLQYNQYLVNSGANLQFSSAQQASQSPWVLVPTGSKYVILSVTAQGTRMALGIRSKGHDASVLQLLSMDDLRGRNASGLLYQWDLTREGRNP